MGDRTGGGEAAETAGQSAVLRATAAPQIESADPTAATTASAPPTYPSQLRFEHVMQFVPNDAELHAGLGAEHGTGQRQPGIVGTPSSSPSFFPFGYHLGTLARTSEFGEHFGVIC